MIKQQSAIVAKMSGKIASRRFNLEEILNEKQVHYIVKESIGGDADWHLVECEIKPAMDGIAGFLGDHMRATLRVRVGGAVQELRLFIKRLPTANKPKAEFIDKCNFFRREVFVYKLLEEIMPENDANPCYSKAFLCTDSMIVMPDLSVSGYSSRGYLDTLDLPHARLAVAAIARFHAAFTNHETRRTLQLNRPYDTYHEHTELLGEPVFCDSPWLRACAKLTVNFLDTFSDKYSRKIQDLESKLTRLNLEACDSLREVPGTLNVLNHKDFWVNNILFRYEAGAPVSAVLIDFQCVRYAPPTFDLMSFLYLTTSRRFRETHEKHILQEYYRIFTDHLDVESRRRLSAMGYDEAEFSAWCERSRLFGAFEAVAIFPFVLMEPKTAQKHFDDPATYEQYVNVDRSEPVLAHARSCDAYRLRQLEAAEEFIERYVLHSL